MGFPLPTLVEISAGSQFSGTEFDVNDNPEVWLLVTEVNLVMGSESKSYQIRKRLSGTDHRVVLDQSIDTSDGTPSESTIRYRNISGSEADWLIGPTDRFEIITTNATSAMAAKVYFFAGTFNEVDSRRRG